MSRIALGKPEKGFAQASGLDGSQPKNHHLRTLELMEIEMKDFVTINVNLSCVETPEGLKILVEGMKPMSLDAFKYWLESACRQDRNVEKARLILPELKGWPEPTKRENIPVTYDTKENPMPKEKKTYEQRISAQITKLRRKHPNASTEQLRKAAEEIERSISEALSGLDFSDLFASPEPSVGATDTFDDVLNLKF